MQTKYNPTEILFIGDILDNHASSYHELDPDGYSAGDDLTHGYLKYLPRKSYHYSGIFLGRVRRTLNNLAL